MRVIFTDWRTLRNLLDKYIICEDVEKSSGNSNHVCILEKWCRRVNGIFIRSSENVLQVRD